MTEFDSKLKTIKGEIISISLLISKGNISDIETRLDVQLRSLALLTLVAPKDYQKEIDFLKDHVWSLIEKINRRII